MATPQLLAKGHCSPEFTRATCLRRSAGGELLMVAVGEYRTRHREMFSVIALTQSELQTGCR